MDEEEVADAVTVPPHTLLVDGRVGSPLVALLIEKPVGQMNGNGSMQSRNDGIKDVALLAFRPDAAIWRKGNGIFVIVIIFFFLVARCGANETIFLIDRLPNAMRWWSCITGKSFRILDQIYKDALFIVVTDGTKVFLVIVFPKVKDSAVL